MASVFLAFEPLTGRRLVRVYQRRTKSDYCRFQQEIVKQWSEAETIVEVQDNLNTHNASSFYENLPASEARALTTRFEMHYTPKKKGSWLNIAELELSARARICLSNTKRELLTGEKASSGERAMRHRVIGGNMSGQSPRELAREFGVFREQRP